VMLDAVGNLAGWEEEQPACKKLCQLSTKILI